MKKWVITTTVLVTLSVIGFAQNVNENVKAFYLGYEEGIYFFEDEYGDSYQFVACSVSVSKEFDLKSDKWESQAFLVTYKNLNTDEEDDEMEIVGLKKIKLEKVNLEEDEYEDDE